METLINIIQTISLVTGVIYIAMQINQHKLMWYFDLVTCGTAIAVYLTKQIWATAILNLYMFSMAIVGLVNWRKIESGQSEKAIHIVRLDLKTIFISIGIFLVGGYVIFHLLTAFTDDPSPLFDTLTFTLSIIGTWWLTRSHLEQWYVWIVADTAGLVLNLSQGLWGLAALYLAYIIAAFFGISNWKKKGVRV